MTDAPSHRPTTSSPAPLGPTLYRNGSVYTAVDPGASAMIIEGGQVVWVGAEQAADSLLDDRMSVVDLDGRLASPAFVDSSTDLTRLGSPAQAAARGLGALVHTGPVTGHEQRLRDWVEAGRTGLGPQMLLWPTLELTASAAPTATGPVAPEKIAGQIAEQIAGTAAGLREGFGAGSVVGLRLAPAPAGSGGDATTGDASRPASETASVADTSAAFIVAVAQAGLRPALAAASREQLLGLLDGLEAAAERLGQRGLSGAGLRVDLIDPERHATGPDTGSSDIGPGTGAGPGPGTEPDGVPAVGPAAGLWAELTPEDIARLAAASVTVCLDPSSGAPVAELYRQGVPVTWGTGGEPLDGWAAVRSLLHHPQPDQRISARAAFVAATRGAWRALGGAHPLAGQLAAGTPATFALWEVEALMVQQAEGTAATWSTDPRARTPLLPALEEEAAPVCTETIVDGHRLPLG